MDLKRLHKIKLEDVIGILTLSLFLDEVINILHRISNINYLKFQPCKNSSLERFQAKEFSFTLRFIINTLIIKTNQRTLWKQEKLIMYR